MTAETYYLCGMCGSKMYVNEKCWNCGYAPKIAENPIAIPVTWNMRDIEATTTRLSNELTAARAKIERLKKKKKALKKDRKKLIAQLIPFVSALDDPDVNFCDNETALLIPGESLDCGSEIHIYVQHENLILTVGHIRDAADLLKKLGVTVAKSPILDIKDGES